MGRRSRRRGAEQLAAPETPYEDAEGNVLVLRGAMTPATRAEYAKVRAGGLDREDAWQRSVEFLFERLAVRWVIAGRRADRAPEGAARALPLREPARSARGSATCCAATSTANFPDLDAP